jgi:hypothetical protein
MTVAACMLLYAAALTWFGPPLLHRITRSGINPQLGVAVWLTAICGVLGAWIAALTVLIVDVIGTVSHGLALTFCRDVLGFAGGSGMPRQLGSIVMMVLFGAGLLATAIAGRGVISGIRRLRSHSHQHARAARIVGRPADRPGVVVVETREPVVYCVAGRPRAVIVTTAALDSLKEAELAAVLAHEHAHLAGRHLEVLMVLRSLAAAVPRLPLFRAGAATVSRLLEMCADDTAARRHGPDPLLCGLLTLVAGLSQPVSAMGAADTTVLARAERLVTPPARIIQWRERLLLVTAITLTAVTPLFTGLLCHH